MTNGTVQHDPMTRQWVIQCPAHITMRLRRVFGGVGDKSHGTHRITDTAENARDLLWFLERYPMEVKDRELLEMSAATHREMMRGISELMTGLRTPRNFKFATEQQPREYQKAAGEHLLTRRGLLLADDVGVGKTVSAMCPLLEAATLPAVVVTLTHLPPQWKSELARFMPGLSVDIARTMQPYSVSGPQMTLLGGFPDVLLISYSKLATWASSLAEVARSVIFDEVQELRRQDSAKYAGAKFLAQNVQYRMGLSATPIYNYGGEIYSVLDCLFPGELGSREEFAREWCAGWTGEKATITDPAAFSEYLKASGMMLRRTRSDVGRELPQCQIIPFHIDISAEPLKKVQASCAELARIILEETKEVIRGRKMRASEEFSNKLRQATGVAKALPVADFVRMLVESGESVVLFGWHLQVYELWRERLKDLKPVFYTGEQSQVQKEAAKKAFMSGESKVMVISLRSGAGLDGLQHHCRTVVFGELDWSPGVHEQCIGRVNRDGQKDPVTVYYMLSDAGADPIMSDVLGVKKSQVEALRGDAKPILQELQVDPDKIRRLAEAYLKGAAA